MGGSSSKLGTINFNMNDRVSFINVRRGRIYGTVSGVVCNKEEISTSDLKTCNLTLSEIKIQDSSGIQYSVNPNEPTLRIENMTIEEANIYERDDTVSFRMNGKIKTGKIIDITKITMPGTNNISINESYLSIALNNSEEEIQIPFTQIGLSILSGKDSNVEFKEGDHVILKINDKHVVVEIVGIVGEKNPDGSVNKNQTVINYKFSDGNIDRANWGSVIKKVNKDTPLTAYQDISQKKKYTLEEDSKYRVKYMKYKAKYLAQKNN
jgi:hypothetical protein